MLLREDCPRPRRIATTLAESHPYITRTLNPFRFTSLRKTPGGRVITLTAFPKRESRPRRKQRGRRGRWRLRGMGYVYRQLRASDKSNAPVYYSFWAYRGVITVLVDTRKKCDVSSARASDFYERNPQVVGAR